MNLDPDLAAMLNQGSAPAAKGSALDPDLAKMLDDAHGQTATVPKPPTQQPYTGSILPFSSDAQGNVHFDPHAGLLGSIFGAVTAPGDIYTGKLNPLSPEANQRALDLATLASPVNPAIRAGERVVPGVMMNLKKPKVTPPTAEALKNAASAGYDAARATGATYPGGTVATAAQDTISGLQNDGILPELAPQTHAVLGRLANPPEGSFATIASLDAARKALGRIGGNFQNPTEQEASRRAINAIDQIIQKGGEAPSVAGTSSASAASAANGAGPGGLAALPPPTGAAPTTTAESRAASLIANARGNSAAAFRSGRLTSAEDAAELRAAAANSGQNIGNALRQKLASLLLNPKAARGYSRDELDAIRQVVQGTATSNILRRVGNMLGGGGGIGHTLIGGLGAVAGGLAAGPEGAGIGAVTLPLVGSGARSLYNSLVQRQIENVARSVRKRSPLYQQMLRNAPNITGSYATPSLLSRGLFFAGAPDNQRTGLLGP